MKTKQWQYWARNMHVPTSLDLCKMGKIGWELVGILPGTNYHGTWFYFKRPMPATKKKLKKGTT